MFSRIKNWFISIKHPKSKVLKSELTQPNRFIIEPEHKNMKELRKEFFCDVCREPALHIAIVNSDTGQHVIGAKCDIHIGMVIRQMQNEAFTGTRMSDFKVHFAGFKSKPYSQWFECSCPKETTHYILSDDARLLKE